MRAPPSVIARQGLRELFRGNIRRTTLIVIAVCAFGLTAHWALMFWHSAHLRSLAQGAGWSKAATDALATRAFVPADGRVDHRQLSRWCARPADRLSRAR
jgi:HAMP domain-containing protein